MEHLLTFLIDSEAQKWIISMEMPVNQTAINSMAQVWTLIAGDLDTKLNPLGTDCFIHVLIQIHIGHDCPKRVPSLVRYHYHPIPGLSPQISDVLPQLKTMTSREFTAWYRKIPKEGHRSQAVITLCELSIACIGVSAATKFIRYLAEQGGGNRIFALATTASLTDLVATLVLEWTNTFDSEKFEPNCYLSESFDHQMEENFHWLNFLFAMLERTDKEMTPRIKDIFNDAMCRLESDSQVLLLWMWCTVRPLWTHELIDSMISLLCAKIASASEPGEIPSRRKRISSRIVAYLVRLAITTPPGFSKCYPFLVHVLALLCQMSILSDGTLWRDLKGTESGERFMKLVAELEPQYHKAEAAVTRALLQDEKRVLAVEAAELKPKTGKIETGDKNVGSELVGH